uniref:Uncharacterized protein n=1 Tax=Solanum lycopersicum TaxID=4081 RepID=A0A3Q7FT82_SOLLC
MDAESDQVASFVAISGMLCKFNSQRCMSSLTPKQFKYPNQFALGIPDGSVHVFEPLESGGKWGVPPPLENGFAKGVP